MAAIKCVGPNSVVHQRGGERSCAYCKPAGVRPAGMLHTAVTAPAHVVGRPYVLDTRAAFVADVASAGVVLEDSVDGQEIADNAHRFYDWMRERQIPVDSHTRELAFTYAAADLDMESEVLYNAWLREMPLRGGKVNPDRVAQLRDKVVADASLMGATVPDEVSGRMIADNAHRMYDWMREQGLPVDSYLRETMFDYAAAETGIEYNDLLDAFEDQKPLSRDA